MLKSYFDRLCKAKKKHEIPKEALTCYIATPEMSEGKVIDLFSLLQPSHFGTRPGARPPVAQLKCTPLWAALSSHLTELLSDCTFFSALTRPSQWTHRELPEEWSTLHVDGDLFPVWVRVRSCGDGNDCISVYSMHVCEAGSNKIECETSETIH